MGVEASLTPLGGKNIGIMNSEDIMAITEENLKKMVASFSKRDQEIFRKMKKDAMKIKINPFEISEVKECRDMTMENYLQDASEAFIKEVVHVLLNFTFMHPIDLSRISALDGLFHLRIAMEYARPESKTFGKDEGIEIITSILEKKLRDEKVELNTSSQVKKIEDEDGKKLIHFEKNEKDFSEKVDKVLITVPATKVNEIDPELDAGVGIFYEKTEYFFVEGEKRTDKRIILGSPNDNPSNIRFFFDTYNEGQQIFPMNKEKDIDFSRLYESYEIISKSEKSHIFPTFAGGVRAPEIRTNKKNIYLAGDYFYFPIIETALRTTEKAVKVMTQNVN